MRGNFETLFETLAPALKKTAGRYNGRSFFIDKDDLYQEMSMYLWSNFKDGVPGEINNSYIVRGCQFHILNYLRKEREKIVMLSLDVQINEEGNTLKDILPDTREPVEVSVNRKLIIDEIKNNGFNKKEKEVLLYLLEGFTVREIAGKLGISHVMVVKYKQGIIRKWREKDKNLPPHQLL